MSDRRHGTRAKYVLDECRCPACSEANRSYAYDLHDRRRIEWRVCYSPASATWSIKHQQTGELVRLADREQAWAEADRRNRAARAVRGDPVWPDPADEAEARQRLVAAREAGIGLRAFAVASGLSRSALAGFLRGRRGRRATVEAILAARVTPAAGSLVDGAETWRLIDEMLEAGATRGRIAQSLGSARPALQVSKRGTITAGKAAAIRDLHDRFLIGSAKMRAVCRCAS